MHTEKPTVIVEGQLILVFFFVKFSMELFCTVFLYRKYSGIQILSEQKKYYTEKVAEKAPVFKSFCGVFCVCEQIL